MPPIAPGCVRPRLPSSHSVRATLGAGVARRSLRGLEGTGGPAAAVASAVALALPAGVRLQRSFKCSR